MRRQAGRQRIPRRQSTRTVLPRRTEDQNVSKKPIYFSDENQALVDTKGKQYSPDDAAWIYLDDDESLFGEINPGNALKTTVPFDISKRTKPDYLLLKAGVFGFSEGVRVKPSS